jgi:hypothetical protein
VVPRAWNRAGAASTEIQTSGSGVRRGNLLTRGSLVPAPGRSARRQFSLLRAS